MEKKAPVKRARKKTVETKNARSEQYRRTLEKIVGDEVCPFCPGNLLKYHTKPILRKGQYWTVTENMHSYKNTVFHFLFIHRRHIETVSRVSEKAWSELRQHCRWLVFTHSVSGGSLLLRFGEGARNGSSVRHLHAHLVVGKKNKPVETRI